MSARDLVTLVRKEMSKLPAEEQARFLSLVTSVQPTTAPESKTKRPVVWEDRTERLREIFGDKMLEKNLVLEERESLEY